MSGGETQSLHIRQFYNLVPHGLPAQFEPVRIGCRGFTSVNAISIARNEIQIQVE